MVQKIVHIRIPDWLFDRLIEVAELNGESMSSEIRRTLVRRFRFEQEVTQKDRKSQDTGQVEP
jgi:hypothetical protein